jgi:hypothetical protein
MDITLTEDPDAKGKLLAHRPDCEMVTRHRIEGKPIFTMLGCQADPPPDMLKRHSCMSVS